MNTKGKLLRFFADLVSEGVDVNDSIKLIMINLKEMNRLWIRIKSIRQFKKVQREKQRMDLKVTVGENVVRLSRLEGVNLELY
jgi:vacuolar protein sorting-associated protein 35